jgi:hypothetical protein
MNIREAIATAKQYTMEVFADEKIADLGLEEVVRDDEHGLWRITVGFSRPRGVANRSIADTVAEFSMLTGEPLMHRLYKVVTIKDASKEVVSLTNRDVQ